MKSLLLFLLSLALSAPTGTRLDRGQHVRDILRAALEQSYAHHGAWPDRVADPTLIYLRPAKLNDTIAIVTPVLYEPIESHPGGVWVGFADGHLEFATDPGALADCINERALLKTNPAAPSAVIAPAAGVLKLQILDPDNRPIAGALAGAFGETGDYYPTEPPVFFSKMIAGKRIDQPAVTDASGRVDIPALDVFDPTSPFRYANSADAPLYVLAESQKLVAIGVIHRREFGTPHIRQIHLQPGCQISGQITSLGLAAAGQTLKRVHAFAETIGQPGLQDSNSDYKSGQFQLFLPAGDYGISADGNDCDYATHLVRISTGQRRLALQIDIPAYAFTALLGRPAPELQDIKAWKNGGPVTLADLRGKVILLNFWGYWCGPCISEMPALMALHDEFKDRGLIVLGVHDDSADSIADLEQKTAHARAEFWAGRDLPFLIALDGGGDTRITYTNMHVRGATTAAYGILKYPTSLLVGRDGKLLEEISPATPEGREEIQKALDAK